VRLARAPGRVNLIGDHTDYNLGLALPMAVGFETTVTFSASSDAFVLLSSDLQPGTVRISLRGQPDPHGPPWGRLAAAIVALVGPHSGGVGRIATTVPVGAGLASSAAFCVALSLALGARLPSHELARLCQQAEATIGADVGLMDPLVALEGGLLLIDFSTMRTERIVIPPTAEVVVVHSGQYRRLADTPYRQRRLECQAAAAALGSPLGLASLDAISTIADPVLRRRARHVVTECDRVRAMATALGNNDLRAAGSVMIESHRSLAEDFEASTERVDALVARLLGTEGVFGARMTGGGFGGCVVAICERGALDDVRWSEERWPVQPGAGASVSSS